MQFKQFRDAVAAQFNKMKSHNLFRSDVSKDTMWDAYLAAFPEGTNPIFRERSEHDCTCCKQFIRAVGNVVAIIDGKMTTIWDIEIGGTYQVVANHLDGILRAQGIENLFFHEQSNVGALNTIEDKGDGIKFGWDHFALTLPSKVVLNKHQIGPVESTARGTYDVFLRSLQTLTLDAVDTVLDLIEQNSLPRGAEQKFAVDSFRKHLVAFQELKTLKQKHFYAWDIFKTLPESVSKIRNTAVGTLLIDLSGGKDGEGNYVEPLDLGEAVDKFGRVMSPLNYKRPTSLVTPKQAAAARATIEELGLTSALTRRFAKASDLTINNVLFADSSARKEMDVFDQISAAAPAKAKKLDKVEEVTIDQFLEKILPKATTLEVMLENRLAGNMVSLIAPADPEAKGMFKWPNKFSWSYSGGLADSIKERVKAAGGSVTGDLCCRLAWEYKDDLDFWMHEPGGHKIYYGYRGTLSPCGGMLDVDANGGSGMMDHPVENIFYADRKRMKDGIYRLVVNNFSRRSEGVGFEVEIEFDGERLHIAYPKVVRTGENVEVAQIEVKKGVFKILSSLPGSQISKTLWNLPTQTFQPVSVVMLSPNHWDHDRHPGVGNKHFFFMLDGCRTDDRARGFLNEHLTEELSQHRKVMEIVGSKMLTEESDQQLSGLGFSSTIRNYFLCRVNGSFERTLKVTI